MNLLYIDAISGLSGDMLVSAFIDAGFPVSEIEKILEKIPIDCPRVIPERVKFGGTSGIRIRIEEKDTKISPSDMLLLARSLDLDEKVKMDLEGMLNLLIETEAKIHGVERKDLHFHELSNIDTFLDFLLVASAIFYFKIEKVFVSPIPHGSGFIKTSHGILPNPPPLTLEMLRGFVSLFTSEQYELTTPTGATIVRYYANPRERLTYMRLLSTGCGIGNYQMEKPDILRIYIGESVSEYLSDEITVIEFDVDDMEMEYVGHLAETLRKSGATEVLYFPVFMKKGRIGVRFSIISQNDKLDSLVEAIFRNSTTFGLRMRRESRKILKREEKMVESKYGSVRIKVGYGKNGEILKEHVEFEDVRKICDESGLPYAKVLEEIKKSLI